MRRKLNCVLLIDDDEPTNYFNEMVIKRADYAEKIVAVPTSLQALDYLKSKEGLEHARPNLIFLDINLPGMNGWDFLEKYRELDMGQKEETIIVILTTSASPADEEKAKAIEQINDFRKKPLTCEILDEILEQHFADYLQL